jgi:tRNA threonylcarbamoyladenosine biosynthesis protein TsaB
MILAIDTATSLIGIALHNGQRLLAEHTWESAQQHSVELSASIERMITQVGKTPKHLTAIGIAQGPGSYTGVRVGMAVAKGLAMALRIPLIPIMTLDIMAVATPFYAGDLIITIHAGRERILIGKYQWETMVWRLVGDMTVMTWEQLLETISPNTLINGDISDKAQALIQQSSKKIAMLSPAWRLRRAGFLAEKALEKLAAGYDQNPAFVFPLYLTHPEGMS